MNCVNLKQPIVVSSTSCPWVATRFVVDDTTGIDMLRWGETTDCNVCRAAGAQAEDQDNCSNNTSKFDGGMAKNSHKSVVSVSDGLADYPATHHHRVDFLIVEHEVLPRRNCANGFFECHFQVFHCG